MEANLEVGIYCVTSPSGKVYVGQSWHLSYRIKGYRKHKRGTVGYQRRLSYSFNKYGVESHTFEIIYRCTERASQHKLNCLEQFFMDWYRSAGIQLLNIREAGSQGRLAKETILLIAASQRGKPKAKRTAAQSSCYSGT